MALPSPAGIRNATVPSLAEICVAKLGSYVQYLDDVGWGIEAAQLRRVLSRCSRAQLACVEDATRHGSGRDLTWLTWHLWLREYRRVYADNTAPPPLPGEPPPDYTPPPGVTVPPGDYRRHLQEREAVAAARMASAAERLRAGYGKNAAARAASGMEMTSKLPPAKRSRTQSAGATAAAAASAAAQKRQLSGKTLAGQPAAKLLSALGLVKVPQGSQLKRRPAVCGPPDGKGRAAKGHSTATMKQPERVAALGCLHSSRGQGKAAPVLALPRPQKQQQQQQQQVHHR